MKAITARIVLPLFYNADPRGRRRKIPARAFEQTGRDLARRFGGCSTASGGPFTGYWAGAAGRIHEDANTYLEVMGLGAWDLRILHDLCRDVFLPRFDQEALLVKFMTPPEFGEIVTRKES